MTSSHTNTDVTVPEPSSGLKSLLQVEARGIEPVPAEEQTGKPGALFWVWFAANISILGLPLGASLVAFQLLNIWQALLVAIVGACGSFAIVGIVSISGRRGGAPTLTLSRATFGSRGNIGPTLIAMISRWGWETVNATTACYVLVALVTFAGFGNGIATDMPVVAVSSIVLFVILTLLVSGLGHAMLLVVQKWATWIFGALNIVVMVFLVATVDWTAVVNTAPAPLSAVLVGIGVIAAGTGLAWANSGADIARYQGKQVRNSSLILTSAAGAGTPLVALIALGAILTTGDGSLASASDPVAAIRSLLPTWMAVPYLIAAFGGLLLSNNLSVYSSGLTILTLGVKMKRIYAVGSDLMIGLVGSLLFVFVADSFLGVFITFISLLAIPLTAWLGVFLIDMVKRRSYDAEALLDLSSRSRYWYTGGIEWRATGSWLFGILIGALFLSITAADGTPAIAGPFADTWIGQNGLAWVATLAASSAAYFVLGGARRTEPLEK